MLKYLFIFFIITSVHADTSVPIYAGPSLLAYTDEFYVNDLKLEGSLIDTGASFIVLPDSVVNELNLIPLGETQILMANNEAVPAMLYLARTITLGTCKLTGITIMNIPKADTGTIIGIDILAAMAPITFDFTAKQPVLKLTC